MFELRFGILTWSILNILSSSMGHIDAQIKPLDSTPMWRFIEFYGNLSTEARNHSWTMLWCLKNMHSLP